MENFQINFFNGNRIIEKNNKNVNIQNQSNENFQQTSLPYCKIEQDYILKIQYLLQQNTDYIKFNKIKGNFDQKSQKINYNMKRVRFYGNSPPLIYNTLIENGFTQTDHNDCLFIFCIIYVQNEIYNKLQSFQKINQFPDSIYLTRKDYMHKAIQNMIDLHGTQHFGFCPTTYVLPQDKNLLLKDKWPNFFIVKPKQGCQGKGIEIVDNVQNIFKMNIENLIVSHYIKNPFLIDGKKFDLRLYVAITSINPLRIYLFDEGIVRFATEKYQNDQINNPYIHLTNYSLNKKNSSNPDDLKWSLSKLKHYFRQNCPKVNFESIMQNIEDVIIKSILSVENMLYEAQKKYAQSWNQCSQLFGYDIILDENSKCWLLEINISPSFLCEFPIDQQIKSEMISDFFNLVGIPNLICQTNIDAQKNVQSQIIQDPKLQVINESLLEIQRKGSFRLIFPIKNYVKYSHFFQRQRENNIIIQNIDH